MKRFQLLLIFLFSAFLLPNIAVACGNSAEKKVGNEMSHSMNDQHKNCCRNEVDPDNDHKSCSSNCEQSCCSCSATSSSSAFNLVSEAIFENSNFNFLVEKETQFSYVSRAISDGFLSIWLIPKIG